MELIQTIWEILSTQNEGLIGIIFNNWGIPFIFIEIAVGALLFTQILDIKYTKKQLICYVLSFALISAFCNTLLNKPFNAYVNMILYPIFIASIFKINFFKAIIAELIPIITIVILETVICKIFTILFNVGYEELYLIPLTRLFITIFIYLSTYLIYKIAKHNSISIFLIENISKKSKYVLIINFIFAVIAIGVQFYIIGFYINKLPLFIILLNMISLVVYFAISIFSLLKTTKLEMTTRSLEEAKLYNKTLQILHDNLRIARHNYSNTMQSIEGFINANDLNGLKEYFKETRKEYINVNNLAKLDPHIINEPAVYSLITSKYHLAETTRNLL